MCNAGLLHNKMKPRRVDIILPSYSNFNAHIFFFMSSIAPFPVMWSMHISSIQSGFHSRSMAALRPVSVSIGAYLIASFSMDVLFSLSSVSTRICPKTITLLK